MEVFFLLHIASEKSVRAPHAVICRTMCVLKKAHRPQDYKRTRYKYSSDKGSGDCGGGTGVLLKYGGAANDNG